MSVSFAGHRQLLGVYLGPQRLRVVGLALLLFSGIGLQLLNPQIIRYFIDTAQAAGPLGNLMLAAGAYLLVGLLARLLNLATTYSGLNVAWAATNALRADLVSHLLRLDMPFHKTHTPGELIERVDGDINGLTELFSTLVVKVLGNGLLVLAIIFLLYRESTGAGAVLTVYTLLTVIALALVQRIGVRAWTAAREAWGDQMGFLEERLAATEDIRGIGAEAYALAQLQGKMYALLRKARGGMMAQALSYVVTNFLYIVGYGLGLLIAALLYTGGDVTIGTAFLIVSYIGMLAAPLDEIRREAENLQQATAGVNRIGELLRLSPGVQEAATATLPASPLDVRFDRVAFRYADGDAVDYGDGPLVLRDVDFTLGAGRVLGVLGRTGSGKTTLTRLLFRLYDPTAGHIALSGLDLRAVSLADLRARVGMVTQDVQLFSATLMENITLFDPAIGEDDVRRALASLDLLGWAEGQPDGLHTRLAAGGAGMSAGEAQLLAFARILLRDPGLVILDEAASRLDPVTERRLERAIDRLLGDGHMPHRHPEPVDGATEPARGNQQKERRTAIIIAHRLSTVQRADDILILEDGCVVEFGERARLAADPSSRFAALLRTGLEEALA
jgi:ATP-binding cassette, subfamily B, bacterial